MTDDGRTDLRGLAVPDAAGMSPYVLRGEISGADLSYAVMPHLRLSEVNLRDCVCERADFEDVIFQGRMDGVSFNRAAFRLAILGGHWSRSAFVKCRFARAQFSNDTVLEGCVFDSCTGSVEFDIELRDVEFRGTVKGISVAPIPRFPSEKFRHLGTREVRASFRHATLERCWFVRGLDLSKIEFPESQEWAILPDAARKVAGLVAGLMRDDPTHAKAYDLFGALQFAAEDQRDMLYVRDDLVREYREPAATRLWEAICRESNRMNRR